MKNGKTPAEIIVAKIVELLEKGVSPWHQPWKNGYAMNVNGNYYRGINAILLSMQGYNDNRWLTFNKVRELGGSVKKGEKSLPVVFYKPIVKEELVGIDLINRTTTTEEKVTFILRYYNVFNVEQCEGLNLPPCKEFNYKNDRIAEAEAIWQGYENKPSLTHGGSEACYVPSLDAIRLPELNKFESAEAYYSTLFHEATHSTGAKNRLDRFKAGDCFGSENYGKEELVAEIGSQILCQSVGITRTLENSAAYCKAWCKAIKEMPATAIISAANQAQKAADFILGEKAEEITE